MLLVFRERMRKHITMATNTHVTIEEPVSKQRIGKHITIRVVGNGDFFSVRAKWL
jgi:hypothetical protein